ncbi:hypothetical protein NLM31_35505 [Bradyrhizobium sp. CCGUVB4N]|uniref:hypothetical protein n=1 Tax=Bradyrhizobium sp. CCGUVB4N TaxID=2949631 RepID=UPI0020B1A5A1|nr:hypothetical protein [Bradyrhizobium sp. CCGUVB4N]MCP3385705.1 hypothetical protein [Bradyrhizobium sp. CCGUVB4N]
MEREIRSTTSQCVHNLRDFPLSPGVYDDGGQTGAVAHRDDCATVTSRQRSRNIMVPHFQDQSFSNGTHMESIDFRYRLSDEGRIVLGPLSSEETREFEELTRRDREGLIDLTSELRLLELYVKYMGSDAKVSLVPSEPASHVRETPRRRKLPPRHQARQRNLVVPMIVVMGMSFMLIALFIS